jgi:hypothetical protein
MKRYKSTSIPVLGLLILALALACVGAGTPVPISDIPDYPGASIIDAAEDPVASLLIESMQEAAAADTDVDAEFNVYSLPGGTAWKDVKDFYIGAMKDTAWKSADDLTTDADVFHMIGWERSKQALGIGFVPEEVGGTPLLLVMLATEK